MVELPFPEHRAVLDDLLVKITPENLLATHSILRRQADDMEDALRSAQWSVEVGRCGGDPISTDAADAFNAKIRTVLDLHWAHQQEVAEAATLLHQTALDYGHTDDDIARALAAQDRR